MESIEEKLNGKYEKFFRYCLDAGKNFINELKPEDFVAYRTEYSVSREEVEQLKNFIFSSEENFSNEFDDSLKKFFEIEHVEKYENIFLSTLNFNNRVQNQLRKNNFITLGELLNYSQTDLHNMKNLGAGSVKNILSTLKDFFTLQEKNLKIRQKNYNFVRENIDEFLLNAVSSGDYYIDVIFESLENFSAPIIKKIYLKKTANKISILSEEMQNKKIMPFIQAYNFLGNNFPVSVYEDLTVKNFPEYLINNSEIFEVESVKNLIKWLNFDLNSAVEKIITNIFKSDRELIIIYERSKGKTLQEIGKNFGMTRERVRQIEAKAVKKFLNSYLSGWRKILIFLYALNDGKNLLTLDDAKKFIEDSYAEIIWMFLPMKKIDTKIFYYDEELKAIIFVQNNVRTNFNADKIIKTLPQLMEENFFDETIKKLAKENNYPEEILRTKFLQVYKRSGKFFHKGRLTTTFKCEYILKERFPNGYKIADETDYSKFIRYLKEIFDEQENFTQRNIDAKVGIIGVLCGRGKYIHRDFVHVPEKIINLVKNFIEKSDKNVLPFKEIFESLKDELIESQITNHHFLQGVIKLFGLPYTLRRDYLTKDDKMNVAEEFNRFIAEKGTVTAQEIKSKFISFNDTNISLLLPQCPEIIRIGGGVYLHSSQLNLTEKDFDEIEKFLRRVCENIPVSSQNLFNLFCEKFADFISRNEIYNHEKLFGILRYMFKNKLYFSRPYVSTEEIKNISSKKVLLIHLAEMEKIDIEDLLSICAENSIHYVATSYLIESLRPEFIRVDEFSLMRPKVLGVTDEIISAVHDELKSAIERNGGWQSARTFSEYEWLPQLNISWNSFLLESIISLSAEKIHVLKTSSTDSNFSTAIFVSDDFAEDDFKSFVLKILFAEHEKQPFANKDEIFSWLKEQGICNTRMPKFLEAEGYLNFLDE